jgi:hypothetical protein
MEIPYGESVKCPHCGKIFIPQRIKFCKYCGKEYVVEVPAGSHGGRPRGFCSDTCRDLYQLKRNTKYSAAHYWRTELPERIRRRISYLKSILTNKEAEVSDEIKEKMNIEIKDLNKQLEKIKEIEKIRIEEGKD